MCVIMHLSSYPLRVYFTHRKTEWLFSNCLKTYNYQNSTHIRIDVLPNKGNYS